MKTKIAILYSRLSGYAAACQRTLKEQVNAELWVMHWVQAGDAPFQDAIYGHIDHRYEKDKQSGQDIATQLLDFQPTVVLMSGWMDKDYLQAARIIRKHGIVVIAGTDTQYTGSLRQQVGSWIAPWYLHNAIDVLWVTGERQRQLANKLGYNGTRCWSGFYACDWDKFARPALRKRLPEEPFFLYVGRYVERKGLDTLVTAYRQYCEQAQKPWRLVTAGAGELGTMLEGEGMGNKGFVQPDDLPALMQRAAAFILPSKIEPWGVVAQEAAAAGLPLICSDACGAAVHLLRSGYNGYEFATGDADHLTQAMLQISTLSDSDWAAMSQASFELSKQYTPDIWARTFLDGIDNLNR